MNDIDKVSETTAEPIKLPDNQRVARAQRFETRVEPWSVVLLAACSVAVDFALGNAGFNERIVVKVGHLRAVGLRRAHITDKRGERGAPLGRST